MEVDVGASGKRLLSIACLCLLAASLAAAALRRPPPPFLGISPQDKWYYYQSALIPCKDGSKSFPRERLNDDFCDCGDGTDEPGTSACPEGRFYCYSLSSKPQLLFSSRVNDHICDCCDGSDEYDGKVTCSNVCSAEVRAHENDEIHGAKMHGSNADALKTRNINNLKELFQKLKELKMLVVVEVILCFFVIFGFFRKRIKFKRRQIRRERNV